MGSPLRPSPEDIAVFRAAIAEWLRTTGQTDPTLLVLGVTPELCALPLPTDRRVIAVDRSAEMIRSLWRGRGRAHDAVVRADWRWMPLAASSTDVVLADGALTNLRFPVGYAQLFAELRRLLRRPGRCVIRCFVRPDVPETPEDVFADLYRGAIGGFHAFKWRLAMALQTDVEAGVAVESVRSVVKSAWEDLDLLAERFGWPSADVRTIEAYRGVDTRYSFPTLAECKEHFSAAGFSLVTVTTPSYELGERCPIVVLEPLDGAPARA